METVINSIEHQGADVHSLFERNFSLNTCTAFVHGPFSDATALNLIKFVHLADAPDKTITVYIYSTGGDILSGLAMYDALKACKAKVVTIGIGCVQSMALTLLQAGSKRLLWGHTVLMAHPFIFKHDWQTGPAVIITAAENNRIEARADGIVAKAMGMTLDEYEQFCAPKRFIPAEEAVTLGLADGIIGG